MRLFVVHLGRDCDLTPLYSLAADKQDIVFNDKTMRFRNAKWVGPYSKDSLSVIQATPQDYRFSAFGYKKRALLVHLKNVNEYIARIVFDLEGNRNPDYLIPGLQYQADKIINLLYNNKEYNNAD